MPFEEKWRDFQEGDLIYGIKDDRARYMKPSGPFHFKAKHAAGPSLRTIDEHATLKTEIQSREKSSGKLSESEQAFHKVLLGHAKYKDAVGGEETNSTVRHKTKGGLYWATLVSSKHVHFVLDMVNFEQVVNKSFDGKNKDSAATAGKPKNRTITGSELRWIYRNRAHPDVQKHVQFWFDSRQCCPPWVSYPKKFNEKTLTFDWSSKDEAVGLWSQYKPKNVYVHKESGAT